jgi:hypothetical protein
VAVRSADLAGNWSAVGTATLTIEAENVAPVATPAELAVDEDGSLPVTVTATDDGGPQAVRFEVRSQPEHGVLTGTAPTLVYRPDPDFHGADSFTFVASDGALESAPATVTIAVAPVNDAPVAAAAAVSARAGVPVDVALAATDVDGDALTYRVVNGPGHGALTGTPPALRYTGAATYAGADTFTFVANDGTVDSAPATVSITVTAAPPAVPIVVSVADDAARSRNVRPLEGATFAGGVSAYVFVTAADPAQVSSVTFSIDGVEFLREREAPFDLAGTSSLRPCRTCVPLAFPFESNLLTVGSHRITATATLVDGSRHTAGATFTVGATQSHDLRVSTAPTRTAAVPLDGAVLSGQRYVFLGPANDAIAGAAAVVFQLDGRLVGLQPIAPYDAFGTRVDGRALPLDVRLLSAGTHRIRATVVLLGGESVVYEATFRTT